MTAMRPGGVYETRPDCPAPRHDTAGAAHNAHCVCPLAVKLVHQQWAEKRARRRRGEHRSRFVDGTGSRRRLRALAAIGWSADAIAGVDPLTDHAVYAIRSDGHSVTRHTRAHVRALYARLCMTPGPSSSARKMAARAGWAPPLAWDDDTIDDPAARPVGRRTRTPEAPGTHIDQIAVERALAGDRVRLTTAERRIVIDTLERRGLSPHATDALTGISARSVVRRRAELRAEAGCAA